MDISQEWEQYTPKLYGYLMNTLRNRELAEDVLQNTWVKALRSLAQFQDRGKGLGPWLFTIARNECLQHWRRSSHEIPIDTQVHDVATTPLASVDAVMFIESVLRELPDADRELLRLRYIADLPISSLSQVLNSNPVTIRVRLHRALSRARAIATKN